MWGLGHTESDAERGEHHGQGESEVRYSLILLQAAPGPLARQGGGKESSLQPEASLS